MTNRNPESDVRVSEDFEHRIGETRDGSIVEGEADNRIGRLDARHEFSEDLVLAGLAELPAGPDNGDCREKDER